MRLIGLTGGIGSGKSTVCKMLQILPSTDVIDLDKIARVIVEPGRFAYNRIVSNFGKEILQEDGTIDRPKLGAIIFSDSSKRATLNRITHPMIIFETIRQILVHFFFFQTHLLFIDTPLLFETGHIKRLVSRTLLVHVPSDLQLSRLLLRNPELDEESAKKRIESQMPLDDKIPLSDWVIDNSGTIQDTRHKIDEILPLIYRSPHIKWPYLAFFIPLFSAIGFGYLVVKLIISFFWSLF